MSLQKEDLATETDPHREGDVKSWGRPSGAGGRADRAATNLGVSGATGVGGGGEDPP